MLTMATSDDGSHTAPVTSNHTDASRGPDRGDSRDASGPGPDAPTCSQGTPMKQCFAVIALFCSSSVAVQGASSGHPWSLRNSSMPTAFARRRAGLFCAIRTMRWCSREVSRPTSNSMGCSLQASRATTNVITGWAR